MVDLYKAMAKTRQWQKEFTGKTNIDPTKNIDQTKNIDLANCKTHFFMQACGNGGNDDSENIGLKKKSIKRDYRATTIENEGKFKQEKPCLQL